MAYIDKYGVEYSDDKKTLVKCPEYFVGEYTIENGTIEINQWAFRSCTGLTSIEIPDSVTKIGSMAFEGCKSLTSIDIPNSVIKIGDSAFEGCTGLSSIEIPSSVEEIENCIFNGCTQLRSIKVDTGNRVYDSRNDCNAIIYTKNNTLIIGSAATHIPNSVLLIGYMAFYGCTGLNSIEIPSSVTEIEDYAFQGCTGLTSIEIPDSVEKFGRGVFDKCSSLKSILWNAKEISGTAIFSDALFISIASQITTFVFGEDVEIIPECICYKMVNLLNVNIPRGVTKIGYSAFCGCTGLTSIVIPNSVINIGSHAFNGCTRLTSIGIPNGLTIIEHAAFINCVGLTSIEIPNSVLEIGNWAFRGTNLSSIVIPDSVEEIDNGVFEGCMELTSIDIPNSVKKIGAEAFKGCTGLTSINIPDSVTMIGDHAFKGCTGLTSINIPDSVTMIGDHAFDGCKSISSIEIPNSVRQIGQGAFDNCSNLKSIFWNAKECHFILYKENPLFYKIRSQITKFVFGEDVNIIPEGICYKMEKLSHVEIPNNVRCIGKYAFKGCTRLTSIEIPNSVIEIDSDAFNGCIGLTSIDIPNSVMRVGSAFENCTGFPIVNGARYADTYLIEVVDNTISEYVIKPGTRFIGSNAFKDCVRLTTVNIPNSVIQIGCIAFENCSCLTSIDIPNSVEDIGAEAFSGCTSLSSIEIPQSVQRIGEDAFKDCVNLVSVTWNAQKCEFCFHDGPFYSICSQITSFVFGDGVEVIPEGLCFKMCNLLRVEIPDSVKEIRSRAFSGLEDILIRNNHLFINLPHNYQGNYKIPAGITKINDYAFEGCSGLTSVEIPNSVEDIGAEAFSGCTGLTSIIIPNSVIEIGFQVFEGCKLQEIHMQHSNPETINVSKQAFERLNPECILFVPSGTGYAYRHHPVFGKFKEIVVEKPVPDVQAAEKDIIKSESTPVFNGYAEARYSQDRTILQEVYEGFKGEFYIPNGVVKINPRAFQFCEGITAVHIPSSVKEIGMRAFAGCPNLKQIILPDGLEIIGERAFADCEQLEEVYIPDTVKKLGYYSFYGCPNIKSFSLKSELVDQIVGLFKVVYPYIHSR